MPAIMIRMLDSLVAVAEATASESQRDVLMRQGEMILRNARRTVLEQNDLDDIQSRFDRLSNYITLRNSPASL
jgi:uncharacterized membrane protein